MFKRLVFPLIAGLSLIVLGALLASCAGQGGRAIPFALVPFNGPSIDGGWTGELLVTGDPDKSQLSLSVNQSGANFSGSILVEGKANFLAGQIRGTINDNGETSFSIYEGGEPVASFTGTVTESGFSGTWVSGETGGTFTATHI